MRYFVQFAVEPDQRICTVAAFLGHACSRQRKWSDGAKWERTNDGDKYLAASFKAILCSLVSESEEGAPLLWQLTKKLLLIKWKSHQHRWSSAHWPSVFRHHLLLLGKSCAHCKAFLHLRAPSLITAALHCFCLFCIDTIQLERFLALFSTDSVYRIIKLP